MIIVIAMKLAFIMMIIKILNKVLKSDIIIFSTPLLVFHESVFKTLLIDGLNHCEIRK